MADRGWDVMGVDFDPAAVRGVQDRLNLEAHVGTAESMVAAGRRFDVVTASHVIEHVPDPIGFLATCAKLLKKGGRLVIKTPNAAGIGHFSYGRSWYDLDPPRHLYVFSRPSLIACGDQAGLSTLSCFSTDANADHVLTASYFLHKYGKCRWKLMSKRERITWLAVSPLLALRARFGLKRNEGSGEELVAVFRRTQGPIGAAGHMTSD
jgi:2-polyprenyl-3-methyl-5-hydroxy-6-metoxy-1,4-benzoquinol methylase